MHEYVSFNCRTVSAKDAFLSAVSSAALYGKGIFTTVAIYKTKPFLWLKHWQRLTTNAGKLKIDFSGISRESIENALAEIIAKNKLLNGRARLTIFDESASPIWQNGSKTKTSFLIQTADFRVAPDEFFLTVSPVVLNSKSPLAGVKSCNYLENILALEDAQAKGFSEAIRLNERGYIASGIMANIFWTKDRRIFTPALETGCLAGTTRAFILENFTVVEVEAQLREILSADEVFLTSAGLGIARVKNIDGQSFSNTSKTVKELQKIFPNFT